MDSFTRVRDYKRVTYGVYSHHNALSLKLHINNTSVEHTVAKKRPDYNKLSDKEETNNEFNNRVFERGSYLGPT